MLYTILEPGQIGYEDPTIKNPLFHQRSQERLYVFKRTHMDVCHTLKLNTGASYRHTLNHFLTGADRR